MIRILVGLLMDVKSSCRVPSDYRPASERPVVSRVLNLENSGRLDPLISDGTAAQPRFFDASSGHVKS